MALEWSLVSTITPKVTWQVVDAPIIDTETFLIRQSFNRSPLGFFLIAQAWELPYKLYGIQKHYPQEEDLIITLPIPAEIKAIGETSRRLALKHSWHTLRYDFSWVVTLYKLVV